MHPQHPYMDPNPWAINPLERESAYSAQQAADFLGHNRVNHELLEAQRMGGDRMAQDVAWQLQAEATMLQDAQRRQAAEAAYYAHPSSTNPTVTTPTVTSTSQAQSSGSKPAPAPQTVPAPRLVSIPPRSSSWEDALKNPRIAAILSGSRVASTTSNMGKEDPFWKEGGGFEILLYIWMGIMIGLVLAGLLIAITR